MDYVPYRKLIKSIVISMMTQSGWVECIRIPIADPEKVTPDGLQEVIEEVHNLFYKGNKVELSVQGVSVAFRGVENNTYKVEGSDIPAVVK